MATWRITFHMASPLLLAGIGPLVPDTWLAWAKMAVAGTWRRNPLDPDFVPNIPLPLAIDPISGMWAISAITFPDPGVLIQDTGYRNEPNSGDVSGALHLFSNKEGGSGPYKAASYSLMSWFTPRLVFWAETATEADAQELKRLLRVLAAVGVGRKATDGFGTVRRVQCEPDPGVSAVWDQNRPRRPIPVECLHGDTLDAPRMLFQTGGPRWRGAPRLCYMPDVATWHPRVYKKAPKKIEQSAQDTRDTVGSATVDSTGSQIKEAN